MVVYTGVDTKLVLNQGKYKFKISNLASKLNWYLFLNIVMMVILMFAMSQIGNRTWMYGIGEKHYYLELEDHEYWIWSSTGSFYLLLNSLVPLDLAVVITIAKGYYTYFIAVDA